MNAFFRKTTDAHPDKKASGVSPLFGHIPDDVVYLDTACQTPRTSLVLEAERDFAAHNACGGRVQYRWGKWVDERVQKARASLLALTGKSEKEYAVAFTLNTTYGINLVVHQLPESFDRIITSDIEHNSVFLPSMTWAKRFGKERLVLTRNADGSLPVDRAHMKHAVLLLNTTSNIDGRTLKNAPDLARDVHEQGGIFLIDAAQTFGHDPAFLQSIDFDAAFGSGHKMYGPSIGFIIIKRSLLRSLKPFFIGGGTVKDVEKDVYTLLSGEDEQAALEPGLQNWSGIVGLDAALTWFMKQSPVTHEQPLAEALFAGLRALPRVKLTNATPSSVQSFSVDGLDAHRLALYLDERKIMCRSGHFCCHYYLAHLKNLPPLLRVSLGLHNTPEHINIFLESLQTILRAS